MVKYKDCCGPFHVYDQFKIRIKVPKIKCPLFESANLNKRHNFLKDLDFINVSITQTVQYCLASEPASQRVLSDWQD
jgi:hypothetical protein